MQNQMFFPGESPLIKGNWYNPTTGDSFTVRDSFFQDNQYIVTTTDGRTLTYNQIQNYIQSEKPINMKSVSKNETINKLPPEVSSILSENNPQESNEGMLPEDSALLGNLYQKNNTINNSTETPILSSSKIEANQDNYIIEKALSKTEMPIMDFQISWKNFPDKLIDMLETMMDISKENIAKWYVSKINKEEICENIVKAMENYINKLLKPEIAKEVIKETTKTKKKNNKNKE